MPVDRSYIAENERERRRLEALVARLDDVALSRPMPGGWTVAGVLAHLAFWDQRIVLFVERLKRDAPIHDTEIDQVDWINDAIKPLQLALPPRRAAEIAVAAARDADRAVETLSDELVAKNAAASHPIYLLRADHRHEHLDEIDAALERG